MPKKPIQSGNWKEATKEEVRAEIKKVARVSDKAKKKIGNVGNVVNTEQKPKKERKRKVRLLDLNRDNVLKAIIGSGGLINPIRKNFGVAWNTMDDFIKQDQELLQAMNNERQGMKDLAENILYSKMIKGDDWAVRYFLATQCKDRGYVERQESDNVAISALVEKLQKDNETLLKIIHENAVKE